MCSKKLHHLLNRKICICFTVYVVFGLRIHCGVLGHENYTFPPTTHLDALYKDITNDSFVSTQNLANFLTHLNLIPSHEHHEHDEFHALGASETHPKEHKAKCYSAEQMVEFFAPATHLNKSQFMSLLPTVVYELHTDACHPVHVHENKSHTFLKDWKAIVACVVAVIVLGCSGLVVVVLVPLMSRSFYNVVTQFLIALSVGSLTGDAFLHLIPHALAGGHSHGGKQDHRVGESSENDHRDMVMKSLVALLGIHAFFLTERLTILCQNSTSRKKMKRQRAQATHIFDEDASGEKALGYQPVTVHAPYRNGYLHPDKNDNSKSIDQSRSDAVISGENDTTKPKASLQTNTHQLSVPEGLSTTHTDPPSHPDSQLCNRPPERPMDNTRCEDYLKNKLPDVFVRGHSGTFGPTGPNPKHGPGSTPHFWPLTSSAGTPASRAEESTADGNTAKKTTMLPFSGVTSSPEINAVTNDAVTWQKQANSPTVFVDDAEQQPTHPHRDKPHGHHHGHSHDLSSVRAIAYTIIAGDGLHNFCDGIAIGAAFANDLRGGLSTSIAVLCHELPHELGDFAVLLHAGMSFKAAFFYNLLSGVLCAAGTAIGLLLGQMDSVDAWLFMLTAGMFVYIALVDMMPELTTNRLKGHRYCHQPTVLFLWQNLGIFLGYLVMLLISLFEDRMI